MQRAKMTFWSFLGMTVITLGIYPWYYAVSRIEHMMELLEERRVDPNKLGG